jgi:D-lyxose ketol-isomerase
MKQSEVDSLIKDASLFFAKHSWFLPPGFLWDVTDFGLNDIYNFGLVLVNLCNEKEYCEKIMYAKAGMTTPAHYHKSKKEDIICRVGGLNIFFYCKDSMHHCNLHKLKIKKNNKFIEISCCDTVYLSEGERITIDPYISHAFTAMSSEVILGEVSTYNDDMNDNFFLESADRFPVVERDID